jgi:hypothetical protein
MEQPWAKMSKRKACQDVEDEVGNKKACGVQSTLFKFFQPSSSSDEVHKHSCTAVATPENYGIHMYTSTEVISAQGLQQSFRKFWNEKALELCSDSVTRCKLKNKAAIQGAIHLSWTLHKTELLKLQAEEMGEDMKLIYPDEVTQKHMLTPITRNLDRMLIASAAVTRLYSEMGGGDSADIRKLEGDLDRELTELRKAQDALNKAIQRRRSDLNLSKRESDVMRAESPIQLSDAEMQQLVSIVREESQTANCS